MCGIAGIYSKKKIENIHTRMDKMISCMKHRGPNNQSIEVISDGIAFAHVRLSIIDLDIASNQPMYSNNKRWLIAFNGEIYNYQEIKKELQYDFKTNGDTEVILAAIEQYGIDWFLERANGMFAIALYDLIDDKLYLIRDRFSIKPLFYTKMEETFIFGSEIKAILNSGLFEPVFNQMAIDEYLGYRMVREPFTFFKEIYQVCGGEYLIIDSNLNIQTKKYYDLPRQNFDTEYDESQLILETKKEIEKAVERWTVADVKVGAYLSGGVDSSLMSAMIATQRTDLDDLNTYTIGFEENNEFKYSKIVADKYHINHKNIIIDYKTYQKEWERLISYNDAPLAVPNEIPLAIMSTVLNEDITVVISGEGADELFGGYGRIYRLPFDYKNHFENSSTDKTFYQVFVENYEYVPRTMRDKYLKIKENYRTYFDNRLKDEFKKYCNEENIFRFFQTYHIKGLLKRVDMTTMQASVEARPPFLDHQLIEFVNTKIPYELKLKWKDQNQKDSAKKEFANQYSEQRDVPKYMLKKVAEYYLPNEIIYRKKVGFPVPLGEWFQQMTDLAKKYLSKASWFNSDQLENLIEDAKNNIRSGQVLWMFLNIELFYQQYFVKKWKY